MKQYLTAKNLISILAVVVMMIASTTAHGQNEKNRVSLPGTAVIVSDDGYNCGLEVGGKLVVKKDYKSFKSNDGKYFVVEAKDGKFGVCNDKGVFLFPCKYVKAAVSESYIAVYETSSTPKFYSKDNPSVEVQAKEIGLADIRDEVEKKAPDGTFINVTKMLHEKAEETARQMSVAAPYGAFSFRTNSANQQELLVDGKVIFKASEFKLVSDAANYNKTNCWFFIVMYNSGVKKSYGVFGLAIAEREGKKVIQDRLFIPFEYSFIEQYEGPVMKCRSFNGDVKYFTWMGKPFDITKKGGGL